MKTLKAILWIFLAILSLPVIGVLATVIAPFMVIAGIVYHIREEGISNPLLIALAVLLGIAIFIAVSTQQGAP